MFSKFKITSVRREEKMEYPLFPCDRCGLCCEHLNASPFYVDLDDGSGMCRYFDRKSRLCTIYEHRPQKCRINAGYAWFRDLLSYEEYRSMNLQACQKLKEEYLCQYHS